MNIDLLKVGDKFVSSRLPLDRAVMYGMVFLGITHGVFSTDPKKCVQGTANFCRLYKPEYFHLPINALQIYSAVNAGEVDMGNWVPCKDLTYIRTKVNGIANVIDDLKDKISSASQALAYYERLLKTPPFNV